MAEKKQQGTSDFTYRDDLGAELHPSDPRHHEAMFYGGEVPAKHELQEVVLGPPAFGSPDPRTLGNVMNPESGNKPSSAPDISEDYAAGKPLFSKASSAPEDDVSSGRSGGSDSDSEKTWTKSQTKAELLSEAQSRGLDVTEENTKEEIVSALEENDAANEDDDSDQ